MRTQLLALLPLLLAAPVSAQIVINNTQSPTYLVQNVLLGGGLTATNITFNSMAGTTANEQIGSFNGTNCNIGLPAGIILGTGDVHDAEGPNNSGSASLGGGNFGASDPDLFLASGNGQSINDKAVLEFDFIPTGDSLKFNFVFASDEYLEYVGSINDVFGFFLSGPDIPAGPYSNGAVNVALVPNTSTAIAINNVNSTSNSQYYINNGTGANAPYNSSNFYVQYDGFTVVMTARHAVTCGLTYHIKIAIGDAADTAWDSAVFLQAGSFSSTGQVVPTLGTGVNMPNDSTIIEGCGEVPFSFRRVGGDSTNADTVHLTIGGTSTPGVDYYPPFPDELIFQPGDTMITFPLNFPFDADGIETLTIEIIQILACSGLQVTNDYTFYIDQFPALYVWAPNVQGQCQQSYVIAPVQEGGTGSYGYLWSTGDTTQAITVAVNATTTFYVTVTDTCSVLPVTDSITVFVPVHPPLQLESETPIKLHCDQDSILLTATYGGGYGDLDIHWGDSLFVTGDQLWVPGEQDGDYIVSVSDECQSSTSQLVHVDAGCEVIIPNVITPNGDGSNDAFVVKGILGRENHVQIFDRWGISVLDVNNYQNDFKAKDLPDGVYFYNIQVLDKKYTGHLTILGNK